LDLFLFFLSLLQFRKKEVDAGDEISRQKGFGPMGYTLACSACAVYLLASSQYPYLAHYLRCRLFFWTSPSCGLSAPQSPELNPKRQLLQCPKQNFMAARRSQDPRGFHRSSAGYAKIPSPRPTQCFVDIVQWQLGRSGVAARTAQRSARTSLSLYVCFSNLVLLIYLHT